MSFDLWDFAEMEAIVPGIFTGEIVCENCGETIAEETDQHIRKLTCPNCGSETTRRRN